MGRDGRLPGEWGPRREERLRSWKDAALGYEMNARMYECYCHTPYDRSGSTRKSSNVHLTYLTTPLLHDVPTAMSAVLPFSLKESVHRCAAVMV